VTLLIEAEDFIREEIKIGSSNCDKPAPERASLEGSE
jgi:hypothetical protein